MMEKAISMIVAWRVACDVRLPARLKKDELDFIAGDGAPYWDETACYRFTTAEIDTLEDATGELEAGHSKRVTFGTMWVVEVSNVILQVASEIPS